MVVLDASVVAKFLLEDENADDVYRVVPAGAVEVAPSIVEFEVWSLLCKHVRQGRLTKKMADEAFADWSKVVSEGEISIVPTHEYIREAFDLSCHIKHSLYDACYLALAKKRDIPLVTADRQLYDRGKAVHPDIILVS